MSILDIILKIKETSSTNAKKDILKENIDNEDLKRVVKLALEPSIVSGIKKFQNLLKLNVLLPYLKVLMH